MIMERFPTRPMEDARLEDLAWLEGTWRGQINGDYTEEVWTGATAGAMMGMFRQASEGRLRFYEFMIIVERDKNIELRIKHFDPDLIGWEDKDKSTMFSLCELGDRQAVFLQESEGKPRWLVFESASESELKIYFMPQDDSPAKEGAYHFRRVGSAGDSD